jgi:hypothetical protein
MGHHHMAGGPGGPGGPPPMNLPPIPPPGGRSVGPQMPTAMGPPGGPLGGPSYPMASPDSSMYANIAGGYFTHADLAEDEMDYATGMM